MMCSERELGMSDDHAGIWILPPDTAIGLPLVEALGADDAILELEPTPNRGDLNSVINIAREIAAITDKKAKEIEADVEETGPSIHDVAKVVIEDYENCPRYAARLVRGIKIGPSPDWLVNKIEACGMRTINNIVDVTNYVMLELGQPLHAFDFNKIRKNKILVNTAEEGDKFTTLDGQEQTLHADFLMILDGEGPVAIAGVMGGLDSEVSKDTVDVLIESAYFKPTSVRRTARLLGVPSEASRRFDKGVDPLRTILAVDRAAQLIKELAGGKIAAGVIDEKEKLFERAKITLRPQRANAVLGTDISLEKQIELLSLLYGMEVKENDGLIEVVAPSYRPDLLFEHDLVEEIARLHGYDVIEATLPMCKMEPMKRNKEISFGRKIRQRLTALGFSETVHTSFEDPRRLDKLNLLDDDPRKKAVKPANPLSENESILRTTLVPKLLSCLELNRSRGETGPIRLYEINAVFEETEDDLPVQRTMLAGVISPFAEKSLWDEQGAKDGFYDVKAVIEQIISAIGFPGARLDIDDDPEPFLHPGKCARVLIGKSLAGKYGEAHPQICQSYNFRERVFIFELNFDMLCEYSDYVPKAGAVSKYPSTLRDIALVVDESVTMEHIIRMARKLKSKILEELAVFDIFRGGSVEAGNKSMAFHARYQSMDRTLTDEEVTKEHNRLADQLHKNLGAKLR
jgi:phenylalanyl-tRNA synthetase beta chain